MSRDKIFQDDGASEPQVEVVPTPPDMENLPVRTMALNDENNENAIPRPAQPKSDDIARRMRREERANRTRKIKVMEVRHEKKETQTVQLNLASPTGPKKKRTKKSAEPTMTINTKEAMDEIYGIFNQPLTSNVAQTEAEEDDSESEYTTGDESTGTGKLSGPPSEYGDETKNELLGAQHGNSPVEEDDRTDVTGWSDFTSSKHVPKERGNHENAEHSQSQQTSTMEIYQSQESSAAGSGSRGSGLFVRFRRRVGGRRPTRRRRCTRQRQGRGREQCTVRLGL